MVRDVVQSANSDIQIVNDLKSSFKLDQLHKATTRGKLLKWMNATDFIERYRIFHWSDSVSEMRSAVKSLKKGDLNLPLTFGRLKNQKLPVLIEIVTDYIKDIGILKKF